MRKRFTLGILAALALAVGLHAQSRMVLSEQLTVDSTSGGVTFTAEKITAPDGTQALTAMCRLETAEIRWTIAQDQTVTASVGTLMEVGDWITLRGHDNLVRFHAIRTTGSSGQLDCTYSNP